jgi:hypothetical protein
MKCPVSPSPFLPVLPQLIKSPYKTYFLNIPYFIRVRKRFDAEKNQKKGRISWILSISIRENVNGITISPEEEKLKSTNWRCGGVRGLAP